MVAAFRLAHAQAAPAMTLQASNSPFVVFEQPPDAHPSISHLVLLVFEAVMQVVCVSLPGYIIARLGHFDAEKQKFLANLNVMLFTPCLIFTKLASQLSADKLLELAVIPVIFVIQTLVSYFVSLIVTRMFGFNKRASNFVTAMGVFGNSNSLPISLVISLSQTLKGLHWDKIPGDNDDEVGARGILYLMIFQQLGQLVRWSWGYHVLLAPKEKYDDYNNERIEEGRYAGDAMGSEETDNLLDYHDEDDGDSEVHRSSDSDTYEPAGRTPVANLSRSSLADFSDNHEDGNGSRKLNGKHQQRKGSRRPSSSGTISETDGAHDDSMLSFPHIRSSDEPEVPEGFKGIPQQMKRWVKQKKAAAGAAITRKQREAYASLPVPLQHTVDFLQRVAGKVNVFLWEFMNPPLWAMLLAVIVASIPELQRLFFEEGSFIKNSVTSAVSSSAGVAVPLILVVLGANLARNTEKHESAADSEEARIGTKLLVASLICRMLLPTLIMAPILALFAKYVPVSILDDPIFVVVCFLLVGAPSALQLAQICQINSVYENVMSKILFQSYVIWILPSTLVLVMLALEVVEWAQ